MAPGSIVQAAFGGGIFRGRRAPSDSVYDAVNALVNDEREVFRRGGTVYRSGSNADGTILGLWDGVTSAGQRTFFWTASSPYVLDSNDSTIIDLGAVVPSPLAAGVEIGGIVFFQAPLVSGAPTEVAYAGSRKVAYSTGTATATLGSDQVVGVGTSWLANVDPGMILVNAGQAIPYGIVKSVESNTVLTMTKPATSNAPSGTSYRLLPVVQFTPQTTPGTPPTPAPIYLNPVSAFHAVAGMRLLRTYDNRVYFSRPVSDSQFIHVTGGREYAATIEATLTDFHELPRAANIVGADSIDDTALLFTTGGMWAISNMALDAVDDVGNVQHQVSQVSQDLILWGEPGIASYERTLIVPAIDDVYAVNLNGPSIPVSEGTRPLYREYVEAGYKPGIADVYRGHYFLPILDASNNVIDSLTVRLDLTDNRGSRRPAWTRQANGAAGRAYATRVGATARTPKLLGLDGLRVSDLTGIFDPDATRKDDADGTDHQLTVISNDIDTGQGMRGNTVLKALVEHELVDAASDDPTATFATAVGAEGAAFTTCVNQNTGGTTAPESDGSTPAAFRIVGANGGPRKTERIRWRWQTTGAAASAILRRVGLEIRQSGRQ